MSNPDDPATLVYECNPEWCDDGYHVEEPKPEQGWLITANLEEFQSADGDCFFVPSLGNNVIPHLAWRMPCGTWWLKKPERKTIAEIQKSQSW